MPTIPRAIDALTPLPSLCRCGCGQMLLFKSHHKYRPIIYISGHNGRGCTRIFSVEHKNKLRNALLGRHLSEETKIKISLGGSGKKRSPEFRRHLSNIRLGSKNPFFNRKHSDDFKNRMRQRMLKENNPMYGRHLQKHSDEFKNRLRQRMLGENNPMYGCHRYGAKSPAWIDGRSFIPYPIEFNNKLKKEIKARDGYTCQFCFKPNIYSQLHVHHIDFNKQKCTPLNLISLCAKCHGLTQPNKNRLYFENYFNQLNKKRYGINNVN